MLNKTYFYNNNIHETCIESKYSIIKNYYFKNNDDLLCVKDKLIRLKKENFNRIHIPEFEYKIKNNAIVIESEFIKSTNELALFSYKNEIVEDIVLRKSDWTFLDFHFSNFIAHEITKNVYAIDLLSYTYCPSIDIRKQHWNFWQNVVKKEINQLCYLQID